MRTVVINENTIQRKWYVVDANDLTLGRLASEIAIILTGKRKTAYSPNQDHGDNVIVINAEKARLSGRKAEFKTYFRHSEYPGGEKFRSFKEQMRLDATVVIKDTVFGMIPKTSLGRRIFQKLHVYAGGTHPHEAQKPTSLSLVKN
ncbi:MAG: 50S ribosomal protein L13 [Chitinivibrionales bacterium]|nr:50S ribosomal protein L13 [Chitinivibrionales bacterium]